MDYRILNSIAQNKTISLLFLAVIAIAYSSFGLLKTKYCLGWDSYFYIDQIKSWVETGNLHSSRINIFYPFLIGINYLVSDYILAYKIASILTFSLFNIGVYVLLSGISDRKSSLLVTLICISNPFLIFFASQYTKNLLGITFLIFALHLLLTKRLYISILLFGLLFFTHKLAFVLGLLFLLLYLVNHQFKNIPLWCLCLTIVLAPSIFIYFFYRHGMSDAVHFPPYSFLSSHGEIMTSFWVFSLVFYVLFFLVILLKSGVNSFISLLLPVLCFLIIPVLKWDLQGISLRMFLVFSILVPVVFVFFSKNLRLWMLLPIFVSMFFSVKSYNPLKQDPPYKLYDYIASKLTFSSSFQKSNLVIAHKSLAEFISFKLDKDVLPWAVEHEIIDDNTYRIVFMPYSLKMKFNKLFKNRFLYEITSEYFLIQEKDWKDNLIEHLTEEEYKLLVTWKNPMLIRPSHMKSENGETNSKK